MVSACHDVLRETLALKKAVKGHMSVNHQSSNSDGSTVNVREVNVAKDILRDALEHLEQVQEIFNEDSLLDFY